MAEAVALLENALWASGMTPAQVAKFAEGLRMLIELVNNSPAGENAIMIMLSSTDAKIAFQSTLTT